MSRRITITFLTPSYVRKLGNNTGPYLAHRGGAEPGDDRPVLRRYQRRYEY